MCCSFVTNSGREMAPMWLRNIQSLCYNSQQYCLYNRGVLLADGCTIYGGKFIINLPIQIADSSQKKTFLGHVGFSLRLTFLFFSSSIFLGPLIKCYTRLNTIQCKSSVMVFCRTLSCSCAGAHQRRYLIFSLNPLKIK